MSAFSPRKIGTWDGRRTKTSLLLILLSQQSFSGALDLLFVVDCDNKIFFLRLPKSSKHFAFLDCHDCSLISPSHLLLFLKSPRCPPSRVAAEHEFPCSFQASTPSHDRCHGTQQRHPCCTVSAIGYIKHTIDSSGDDDFRRRRREQTTTS